MAAELGFEPRQTESESVVLPLHNSAMFDFNRLFLQATYIIIVGKFILSIVFYFFF